MRIMSIESRHVYFLLAFDLREVGTIN
jgi:hypothetical protein